MGKITFILGGARSGKSTYALKLAKKYKKVAFVATCQALDSEMQKRILAHKKMRPKTWKTFAEPQNISSILKKIGNKFELILIDCLTLSVSNLMLRGFKQKAIEKEINEMLAILKKIRANAILISNEVGLGIVPKNKLARDFRDTAGKINQLVAEKADVVFFLISGIPWKIK